MKEAVEYKDQDGNTILGIDANEKMVNANPELIGNLQINRDIFYRTQVEQSDGSFKEVIRVFLLKGSYVNQSLLEDCLKLEAENLELNEYLRKIERSSKAGVILPTITQEQRDFLINENLTYLYPKYFQIKYYS